MASHDMTDVHRWIQLAAQQDSVPQEVVDEWQDWVTRSVIDYPLAPREARAILEVFGFLAVRGVQTHHVLQKILALPEYQRLVTITQER